jgi:hypothetical protein
MNNDVKNRQTVNADSLLSAVADWSTRAKGAFANGKLQTVFDVYDYHRTHKPEGLMKIPNFGETTFEEVRGKFMAEGLPDLDKFNLGYNQSFAHSDDLLRAVINQKIAPDDPKFRLLRTCATLLDVYPKEEIIEALSQFD